MSDKPSILEEAKYIVTQLATIRETAKHFKVSRMTIYNDMVKRLPKLDPEWAQYVHDIIQYNKSQRAHRGGTANGIKSHTAKMERLRNKRNTALARARREY